MSYYIISKSDELIHYGILGQKWGIRRYQNPDGTLTEAGKKRYLASSDSKQYTLTKEGQKREKESYDKLYGKGSHDRKGKELKKWEQDTLNDMFYRQDTQLIRNVAALSAVEAKKLSDEHRELVNKGEMFTQKYYDTKLKSLQYASMHRSANLVLGERKRLLDVAKKEDKYSLDFLEQTPDNWDKMSNGQRIKEYERWLDNPTKY